MRFVRHFLYVLFGIFFFTVLYGIVSHWKQSLDDRIEAGTITIGYDYEDGRLDALFSCKGHYTIIKYDVDSRLVLESIYTDQPTHTTLTRFLSDHGEMLLGATGGMTLRMTYPELVRAARGGAGAGVYSMTTRTVAATILGFLSGYPIGKLVADELGMDCWDARRADWLAAQDWRRVTTRMVRDAVVANNLCISEVVEGRPGIVPHGREASGLPASFHFMTSWENAKRFLYEQGAESMIALREGHRSQGMDVVWTELRVYSSDELRLAHYALLECMVLRERFLSSVDPETDDEGVREDLTPTFIVPRAD